ncbi:MAG: hypothetical protein Q7S12_02985 [bacterium]|nr:hypothetical protein [bacterium]
MPQFIWALVLALVPFSAGAKTIDEIISVVQLDIIKPLTIFFFAAATIFFLYGVVEYIMGASNEEARTVGKRHMIWGLTGLVIMTVVSAIIGILQNFFNSVG